MEIACIIVAAGRGTRAGGDVPKQYRLLGRQPVLTRAIGAVLADSRVGRVVCVIDADDGELYQEATVGISDRRLDQPVYGGPTRSESVRNGLESLAVNAPNKVLIHDAARPFLSAELLDRVIGALASSEAVFPCLPVTDTIWSVSDGNLEPVDRQRLARAQTPQGFTYGKLLDAHRRNKTALTDDIAVARVAGLSVQAVAGSDENIKLTSGGDFVWAERAHFMDVRTGTGYDVHAFCEGDHVTLCGIKVPHSKGLLGHSDADVAMHAITDAIFGAVSEGDIGQWFPPSEAAWKGADSAIFLRKAVERAMANALRLNHLDCTIVCEAPKIGPHAESMRKRISEITGLPGNRISIKATTSEGLGFTGRGEGIAAMATATLVNQ